MTRFGEAKALRCWVQWWHEQIEATGDALLRALLRMQRLHLAAAFSRWRSSAFRSGDVGPACLQAQSFYSLVNIGAI